MINESQLKRAAITYKLPVREFIDQYKKGLRWCKHCENWVEEKDILVDTNYTLGYKPQCLKCANHGESFCPDCGGDSEIEKETRRGLDIRLDKKCVECGHRFATSISRYSGKEKIIENRDRGYIRRDLTLEAELCGLVGDKRLPESYRVKFKEWLRV